MAQEGIPPQIQEQLQQLQQFNAQLQATSQQRSQFEAMKNETDKAIEALKELEEDATVYRSVGSLLLKDKGRDAALKRLEDDQETLEVRVKRMRGQEEELRKNLQELQQKLQSQLGGA